MNEDFVSFEQAVKLKAAGFDWKCSRYYCAFDNGTDIRFWNVHPAQSQNRLRPMRNTIVADAPTLAKCQKWLREVEMVEVNASFDSNKNYWFFYLSRMDVPDILNLEDISDPVYSTYEQALSAAIDMAFELIEKK